MQFGILRLQQGSSAHSCTQFGILPLQQGSSAHLCIQFGIHVLVLAGKGLNAFSVLFETFSEDYHDDMDGAKFELWLNRVLPKLPPGSVVVMDNASYHTKKV
jgi:hypothetical protein